MCSINKIRLKCDKYMKNIDPLSFILILRYYFTLLYFNNRITFLLIQDMFTVFAHDLNIQQ